MQLIIPWSYNELNSLSDYERTHFETVCDLFIIQRDSISDFVINDRIRNLLINKIIKMFGYFSSTDNIDNFIDKNFVQLDTNFLFWRLDEEELLDVSFLNFKDIKLIATVILNYLIFKNDEFKKITEENNLLYTLTKILNIIYYESDPKKLYELFYLEDITCLNDPFGVHLK